MSKKDLLERLNRPSDGRPARRPEGGPTRRPEDAVTTRVSRKVVRRRRRSGDEEPAAPEAVEAAPAPAPAPEPEAAPAPEPATEPVVAATAEPVPTPEPAAPEPPAVEAAPAPAPAPAEAVEAKPAPVETVEEPPAPTPEKAPADPAPAAEAPPAAAPEPVAAAAEKAPAADAPPAGSDPGPGQLPSTPKFTGLGVAVVMPPPGYDPTNPHAWRREQPAAPAAPAAARGRRRVDASPARPERGRPARRGRSRGGGGGYDNRMRRKPRRKRSSGPKAASPAPKGMKRRVRVDHVISVRDLAKQLQVKATVVLKTLLEMGSMANITDMIDIETATLVANEFEYEVENVGFQEDEFLQHVVEEDEAEAMVTRPPVVTIMGHVDHGKTTLLDAIRESRVAKGEAGGITQHIGAYQVPVGDSTITFLDTPGHAAFTAMRAQGADVTDIVVLVVAADDGVQPQTAEAIQHAQAAGVPIIVAVNKMDKPGVNPDTVKQQLTEYELIPEEWGGETLFAPLSALRGDGIDELLEMIHLQAELLDLQANPDRHAEGIVIEAKMERGRGAVASVLVQQGTIKAGDYVVLGSSFGRIRAMLDHRGKPMKTAGPSTPVELFGLSELPEVGDSLAVVKNEKNARKLADHRADQKKHLASSKDRRKTAEDLFAAAAAGSLEKLHVILKADVQGTLQAIKASLEQIKVDGTEVNILLAAVGDISESDVMLAASDTAVLLGFNVKLDSKARRAADGKGVEPEIYSVIYALLDSVEARLKGLLAPEFEQVLNGRAEVRALFKISKMTVAGCFVGEGVIGRNDTAKVLRGNKVLWEGNLKQLKRFKDDVREVRKDYECGISLEGFNDLEEGDVIETYRMEEIERV